MAYANVDRAGFSSLHCYRTIKSAQTVKKPLRDAQASLFYRAVEKRGVPRGLLCSPGIVLDLTPEGSMRRREIFGSNNDTDIAGHALSRLGFHEPSVMFT